MKKYIQLLSVLVTIVVLVGVAYLVFKVLTSKIPDPVEIRTVDETIDCSSYVNYNKCHPIKDDKGA